MTMGTFNQDRAILNHICEVANANDLHPVWQKSDFAGPGYYVISDGTYEMTGPYDDYGDAISEAEDQIACGDINNEELI